MQLIVHQAGILFDHVSALWGFANVRQHCTHCSGVLLQLADISGRRRLLEWLAEQLLIARLPVRIPPKARGISVIPPIFDGCGHS